MERFPRVLNFLLYAALVLFISLFFPSGGQFEYEYRYGERWRYANLSAPFDYPLLKSKEEIMSEHEALERDFVPYYRWDKRQVLRAQDSFRRYFEQQWATTWRDSFNIMTRRGDSALYLEFGLDFLRRIYERRLIEIDSLHTPMGTNFRCNLVSEQEDLGLHQRNNFIDLQQATHLMIDTLSLLVRPLPDGRALLPLLTRCVERGNVAFDAELTAAQKKQRVEGLLVFRDMMKAGALIIAQEGIVDSIALRRLDSLRDKYTREINVHKSALLIYLGYLLLTVALLMIYFLFIELYEPQVLQRLRHLALPMTLIALYAYLSHFIGGALLINVYLLPFCIVPIVVLNFFSHHLALFTHIVVVLLCSMLLSLDYQFILVQLIAGMVAILTRIKTRYMTDFFVAIFYIGIVYTAGFISLDLIRTGAVMPVRDVAGVVVESGVRWELLGWIALNVFFTLLSYPLIPLLERMFGLTSEITLVELADLNKPLLKELSIRASGTLQHSLQVAHLSEAAATAIGANALLVRVAALYHDIGKMENPQFFIENQQSGNPHTDLPPLESAKIIIAHVTNGIRLAKKYALPPILIDFIRTHHGTTRAEYFFRQYKNEHPDDNNNDHFFAYAGPRPRTREEAILMIADSLEAASRSLINPTTIDIDTLVDNIIRGKVANAQLNDSNLSFRELETIKVIFKQLLKSIRHARVAYPTSVG